eukprot:TRINITY_DN3963_c0_g2_i1.p2 TRINITY_DN3963_c0_g2~~TRINITY_DN3963_c0_g2_i1.p2  ORF type:complete len:273 (+),score=87.90 TRINITY_DN3963_c0_g2_i1:222-1040(+)
MDAWAESYGSSAAFICVCCDGQSLAYTFREQLKLKNCHNTWVGERHMPTWGQLGCSGLIVIDGADNVVCRASPAYLDVKEVAFRYVEEVLGKLTGAEGPRDVPAPAGGGGGCVNGTCGDVKFGVDKKAEKARPDTVEKVASVKVDVLDQEHEECEAQLRLVFAAAAGVRDSKDALQGLLQAYEAHFAHEEALLDQHLYADVASQEGFSADRGARTSHFADHQAMIATVKKYLRRPSDFNRKNARSLAAAFHSHATKYDGNYADRLSAAMAAA